MHDDDLDRLLEGSKPPVAARSPELKDALGQLQRSVASQAARTPRTRKARVVIGGLSLATFAGMGAAAAAVVPSFWPDGADVKTFRTADGTHCESVITISDGPVSHGSPTEASARQREARLVAQNLLRDFEYVRAEISEEMRDADYLPVEEAGTEELSAFVHLAQRAVDAELDSKGLPEVNLALESACGENLR